MIPANVSVTAIDGVASYQILTAVGVGVGYEHFFYTDRYKALLPIAALEDRLRIMADLDYGGWEPM